VVVLATYIPHVQRRSSTANYFVICRKDAQSQCQCCSHAEKFVLGNGSHEWRCSSEGPPSLRPQPKMAWSTALFKARSVVKSEKQYWISWMPSLFAGQSRSVSVTSVQSQCVRTGVSVSMTLLDDIEARDRLNEEGK
jgi:hypothetical protein